LEVLPTSIDTISFKLLSKKEILTLVKRSGKVVDAPNYLYLKELSKTDSGYYISLQSLSCFPYGGGGSLGLYINKDKDTFRVSKMLGSSIN
jgi:hypothetical protein